MDQHMKARLTAVLEAEGLDALVSSTTENLQYLTGFRSIAHALFRGLELYGVFTRRGVGLVIPFIDATGVSSDGIEVDRIACYGSFFFNYTDAPGPSGPACGRSRARPRRAPRTRWSRCWAISGRWAGGSAWTRRGCSPPRGSGSTERLAGTTLVPAYALFRDRAHGEEPRGGASPRAGRAHRGGRHRGRAGHAQGRRHRARGGAGLRAGGPEKGRRSPSSPWSRWASGRRSPTCTRPTVRSRRATSCASTWAASIRATARTSPAPPCSARRPTSSGATTTRSATASGPPSPP